MSAQPESVRFDDAERFLAILAPGELLTFQTFDDSDEKRPSLIRVIHGELSEVRDELMRLNEAGAGVFATINETDGNGRKGENITRPRAVFVDFDKPEDNPLQK